MALCKVWGSLTSFSSTRSILIPQFLEAEYSTSCQTKAVTDGNYKWIKKYEVLLQENNQLQGANSNAASSHQLIVANTDQTKHSNPFLNVIIYLRIVVRIFGISDLHLFRHLLTVSQNVR